MKFSTKLILSFVVVTFLFLAIGITFQYLNYGIKDQLVKESGEAIRELKLSGEMEASLYKSLISTHYLLEDRYRRSLEEELSDSGLSTKQAWEHVRKALQSLNKSLMAAEAISDTLNPGDTGLQARDLTVLGELKDRVDIYNALIDQLVLLTEQSYEDGKEFFTVTIEPYFRTNMLPLVDQFREETQKNLDREITKLDTELSELSKILAIATAAALILSLILAYLLYRSIAIPLQTLAVAARHIGAGNLDERIAIKSGDEVGELSLEFNKMAENLSKTTVSKDFMDDIIESMADALIVTDEHGHIRRVNSATMNMLGYAEEELIGRPISFVLAGEQESEVGEIQSEQVFKNHETSYRAKGGSLVPVSLSRALIHDRGERVRGLVCVASDITQRKLAEEQLNKSLREKEILLAEIHHRVKNNLAVVSGLLQMKIWEAENEVAETALKDSQLRVQSIALVHEKLYQSESLSFIEFDKYIHDLLQAINSTYADSAFSISIKTELDRVVLNINQAIPCSLLLNELVINAFKHAFAHNPEGEITIRLWKEVETRTICLVVKDNGRGLSEEFKVSEPQTLGMSLIETLVQQLDGEIRVYNDSGAVFEVSFTQEDVV